MAVTYKYLTVEQQRSTAETQAFAYEHAHLVASIDLAADPDSPEKLARVSELESLIAAAKQKVIDAGGVLPADQAVDGEVVP